LLSNVNPFLKVDRDSIIGKATRYGLDHPRMEFRWGWDFPHSSRPALGFTNLLYSGYRGSPGSKVAGAWLWPPTPI